ncbi:hypothetical protein M3627_07025 [Psychrobacillus sp. MER TA 171]|nr:hypothetical protein [Psychrobacillus sp. MER TA 171]
MEKFNRRVWLIVMSSLISVIIAISITMLAVFIYESYGLVWAIILIVGILFLTIVVPMIYKLIFTRQ